MEGIQETTMAKHISIVLHQPRGMSSSVRVQSSLSVSFFWVWRLEVGACGVDKTGKILTGRVACVSEFDQTLQSDDGNDCNTRRKTVRTLE